MKKLFFWVVVCPLVLGMVMGHLTIMFAR